MKVDVVFYVKIGRPKSLDRVMVTNFKKIIEVEIPHDIVAMLKTLKKYDEGMEILISAHSPGDFVLEELHNDRA